MTKLAVKLEPGYYWAKLLTPTNMPEGEDWASFDWEIVQVNDNCGEPGGPEEFSVSVPGIPVTQWPKDFEWGERVPDRETSQQPAHPSPAPDARYDIVALEAAREIMALTRSGEFDDYLKAKIQVRIIDAITSAIGAGGQAVAFEGQGLTPYGGFLKVHINGVAYSHATLVSRLSAADELDKIAEMLDAGQGDDDGAQILPDFLPDMSVAAKVESCLHSLEDNRDLIEALSRPDPAVTSLEWRRLASGCGAEAYSIVGKYWVRDGQFWAPDCTVSKPFRTDEAAKAAAQADYEQRILSAIAHPVQPGWRPTHRHVKRGSEYTLLGIGKMQTSNWMDEQWSHEPQSGNPPQRTLDPVDMREVAIYRAEDGQLWVRPREEFEDGRFEAIPAAPQPKGE